MKEKQFGVKSSMQLPKKQAIKQSVVADVSPSVERLHSKEVVRLSLDVPTDLYEELKSHHFKKGYRTTRAYLLALIERDLSS